MSITRTCASRSSRFLCIIISIIIIIQVRISTFHSSSLVVIEPHWHGNAVIKFERAFHRSHHFQEKITTSRSSYRLMQAESEKPSHGIRITYVARDFLAVDKNKTFEKMTFSPPHLRRFFLSEQTSKTISFCLSDRQVLVNWDESGRGRGCYHLFGSIACTSGREFDQERLQLSR